MIFTQKQAKEQIAALELQLADSEQAAIDALEGKEAAEALVSDKDQTIVEQSAKIGELEEAQAELATSNETLAAEVATLKGDVEAKEEEVQEVAESVAVETVEALAAIGQDQPLPEADNTAATSEEIKEQFNQMKPGQERTDFYLQHKDILSPFN